MTTFTIVDKDKDPLGPNEINAGTDIEPADGDIFIIDPTVDADINFTFSGEGAPPAFEIQINATQPNIFNIKISNDLSAEVNIADNVDADGVKLDAKGASTLDFNAGDNVRFGQFDGSTLGVSTVVLGDDFTTVRNWKFGTDNDVLTVGNNATFADIDTGNGDDTITFGADATVNNIDAKAGNDTLSFKMGLTANDIKGADGNDTFNVGANANVNKFDGGNGFDTLNTKSPSQTSDNMESTNVVCFGHGTLIETEHGPAPVEDLRVGQRIVTLDHGLQPLRWMGQIRVTGGDQMRNPKLRPIRIRAGTLGLNRPARDLFVSPNHRVLIKSPIVQRMLGAAEVFVAAKKLTSVEGIDAVIRPVGLGYFHLLFDRHEALVCENAVCESLYLGPQSEIIMGAQARLEIEGLCHNHNGVRHTQLSRPCCEKAPQVMRMIERHTKNNTAFLTGPLPLSASTRPALLQCA